MKYLIYGAGTIGITYGWLLSQENDVDILVKPEHCQAVSRGVTIAVKDLRIHSDHYENIRFQPHCVTEISEHYDVILVCVNRLQLKEVLPCLSEIQDHADCFGFMQNNWNIQNEIEEYMDSDRYFIAFPSSVGGGRDENGLEIIIFDEATRLGGNCLGGNCLDGHCLGGNCQSGIEVITKDFARAGIKTQYDENIFDWLKVHYLQQSITAGAVLENGDFKSFADNRQAVRKMVKAFREGIEVCRRQGIRTGKTFPANMFKLPLFIVTPMMQKMFLDTNTAEMVNNHMKKGLSEWIAGYKEVLSDGLSCGLPMTVWKSYDIFVERYLNGR